MNHPKERRAGRLFPFPVYGQWWVLAGLLILAFFFFEDFKSQVQKQFQVSEAPAEPSSQAQAEAMGDVIPKASAAETTQITPQVRSEIESLFAEVQSNPENKEELLLSLKRLLQQTFEGQEDCWSCEGTTYFDRFDQIAGSGEARKPLGFREWIELGDDAFEKNQTSQARRYYTQALEVIDERALDIEGAMDIEAISRVRDRCVQLECR